jgi:hypothetical protein
MNATAPITDRPLAAPGLTSYRYAGTYGPIMIGAKDNADALREVDRGLSIKGATLDKLEVWDGARYVPVTVPPVLDEKADPLGYNVDKLRTIAGALALKKGGKGLSRDCTRALLRALAAIQNGANPEGALFCIRYVTKACGASSGVGVRHLADQAIPALEALGALVRAVPARWFPGKPATLAQACAFVRRESTPKSPADPCYVWSDGAQWTDGKALLLGDAQRPVAPALLRAVNAAPLKEDLATRTFPQFRRNLERYGTSVRQHPAMILYGAPLSNATAGAMVRDGDALAHFAAHNLAILKAHGAKVYRLVSFNDVSGSGSRRERNMLAAWTAKGEPVGFIMPISYAGKEAEIEAAALATGATWGQL